MTKEEILFKHTKEHYVLKTDIYAMKVDILKAMEEYTQQAIAEHEAKKTVIYAKALRKKDSASKWYYFNGDDWCIDATPIPFDGEISDVQEELEDAELIDIEIVIPEPYKEGGEG